MIVRGVVLFLAGLGLALYLWLSPTTGQPVTSQAVAVLPDQSRADTTEITYAEEALFTRSESVPGEDMRETYCLWPDDTLGGIAAAAGVTVEQIMAANPDFTGFAGSMIYLPEGSIPPHQWSTPRPTVSTIDQLPFGVSGYYISYDNRTKRVALSFDIGYTPENHEFMRWLDEQGIHATFLLMGYPLARYPEVIGHVLDNGHELGNHSYTHENMQAHSPKDLRLELNMTEKLVQQARPGATTKPLFRAPFGAITPEMVEVINQEGYEMIGWTIDSLDWHEGITTDKIYDQVTQNVCPGAIIALHDINPASEVAIPRIIDYLRRRGYTFGTVSELLFPPQSGG